MMHGSTCAGWVEIVMSRSPSMRLYWSSRSPFVRKAMVAAHETGVISDIETVRVEVSAAKLNADVMGRNPLNKIPTLVLGNGEVRFDSHVICEYFDSLHSGPKLFPAAGAERWTTLRRESVGNGIMENGVARIGRQDLAGVLQSDDREAAGHGNRIADRARGHFLEHARQHVHR